MHNLKIKKGFVIRLYPNAEQIRQIRRTAGCARWLYNEIVAVNQKRRDLDPKAYLLYGRKLNYLLPRLKEEHPWLKKVDSTSLTRAVDNISNAYTRWLSGLGRKPKFKKRSTHTDSFISKCANYVTVSWAFYDLEQKLKNKASLNRQLMIKVDPAYTSQCCPKCGHIDRGNHDKKNHIFKCRACGYQSNDDRIAAMNLCGMGIKYLAESQESISLL